MYPNLDQYQKEAYHSLLKISHQHRGALLCDGVGLGKTFVGLLLIERLIVHDRKRVVLIVPKSGREPVWERNLRKYLPHLFKGFSNLRVYSHTDLMRTGQDFPEQIQRMKEQADVIIVDEAHHFRNRGLANSDDDQIRSRYWKLYDLAQDKTVFLLTATPVNNHLTDFQHLIEIFSRVENPGAFATTLGIHALPAYFQKLEKQLLQIVSQKGMGELFEQNQVEVEPLLFEDKLFRELVVQRSRAYVKASQEQNGGRDVIFPVKEPPAVVAYSVKKTYGHLLGKLEKAFARQKPLFALALYYPLAYWKGDPTTLDQFDVNRQKQVVRLIRILFLKRFESSIVAFESSCQTLLLKLLAFLRVNIDRTNQTEVRRLEKWEAQNEELLIHVRARRDELNAENESEETDLGDEFIDDFDVIARENYKIDEIFNETYSDLETIVDFLEEMQRLDPSHDDKLKSLVKLLSKDAVLKKHKVIIFTEFMTTARYLKKRLVAEGIKGVDEIDSNSSRDRAEVIQEFTAYLRDELDWPIEAGDAEDITFDYTPSELGLDQKAAVRIKEIKQLRPLAGNQPWGIFFVNFEKKRLPVVVMRLILRALVLKKRASANKAERQAWQPSDLLFISAYGEDDDRAITFAHFVENPGTNLAELRVLGWDDDDTPLHMGYVAKMLCEKLHWNQKLVGDPEAWRRQWSSAFLIRHRHVIRTSEELADALAVLAKTLRNRIQTILRLEDGMGEIRKLQRAFQQALIHDLDDEGFADMFAQTVTYGLFSVSVRRTFPGEGTAVTKDDVPNLIFTSPFLKEMLGIFLGIRSRKGKIDFDQLGVSDVSDLLTSPDTHMEVILADFNNKTRGEDPVIHFYEHFLSAYNKKLKIQRGVFYTPQPVVSYIVRSVHELLQSEFGLADGLADTTTWGEMVKRYPDLKLPRLTDEPGEKRTIDAAEPFVQILDPATGTATFLVEVIDLIHRTLMAKWSQQRLSKAQQGAAWNDYVPKHLLPRLHAFELMMAPYAIAHMKIGLKLAENGYLFGTEERARIYLTNALEPWQKQLRLPDFEALAHEAAAVNEIKRHKRFTVIIGNPPYAGHSANNGPWIESLVDDYLKVNEVPLKEANSKWLRDDYVKFVRFGQEMMRNSGAGIFSFITNHGYIDNPTFRGMRFCFAADFRRIWITDLHGNLKKRERDDAGDPDENVFDIQQGVAVFTAVFGHSPRPDVGHTHMRGTRFSKYARLSEETSSRFASVPTHPDPPSICSFLRMSASVKSIITFSP